MYPQVIAYLLLSVIQFVTQIYYGVSAFGILKHVLFAAFWTFIIYYLCSQDWNILAWIIVFGPIVFTLLILLIFGGAVFAAIMYGDPNEIPTPMPTTPMSTRPWTTKPLFTTPYPSTTRPA
jgi:hypothetical protein